MRRYVIAALVLGTGGFTACGDGGSANVTRPSAPPEPALGSLSYKQTLKPGGPLYSEGAVSFVRIETDGRGVAGAKGGGPLNGVIRLKPGAYRLVSFQRPCEAACPSESIGGPGSLDPPTDGCSRAFEVEDAERLHARISVEPGRHCVINLTSGP
jgi:hypothetical protein